VISKGSAIYIYPEGYKPGKEPAMIYVETKNKSIDGYETIDKVIAEDVLFFMTYLKNPRIRYADSIETFDKKWATVKRFLHDNDKGNIERLIYAYINENKIVIHFSMYFRKENDFKKYIGKLKEVISSYYLLSDSIYLKITDGQYEPYMQDVEREIYMNLNNDSTFKYLEGYKIGFGRYSVSDDNILLDFDTVFGEFPDTLNDTVIVQCAYETDKDTLMYKGEVLDIENYEPLAGAIVKISKFNNNIFNLPACESDENGNFNLKIHKSELPFKMSAMYVGYGSRQLEIYDSSNKIIRFNLKYRLNDIITGGTRIIFKIRNINDRFIELKKSDDYEWMTYVKRPLRIDNINKVDTIEVEKLFSLDKPPKCLNYYEIMGDGVAQNSNSNKKIYIRALLGLTGEIQNIEVINADKEIEDAAISTAMKLKFEPGIKHGHPVKVWICFPIYLK
jgi:hypothetical protein